MKYKVIHLEDNIYQVAEKSYIGENWVSSYPPTTTGDTTPQEFWNIIFQGTLPECEAWISLREKNYI